jgi:RecA/RadA recombinase
MSKEVNVGTKKNIMNMFAKDMKKSGVLELSRVDFMQSTGFDLIDINNGSIDKETGKIHMGFNHGRIFYTLSRPGCGKTALCIQIAKNMCHNFPNSQIYHLDIEHGTNSIRIKNLTGISEKEVYNPDKDEFNDDVFYYLIQRKNTTESLHHLICKLYDFKMENKNDLVIEMKDTSGTVQEVLPPTIIILDSLGALSSKNSIENDELNNNMAGGSSAKANNSLFKQDQSKLEEANIHLFIINQITDDINISFTPKAAIMNFMKQGEALSGGKMSQYFTDCMIKLVSSDKYGIKDERYGEGLSGFIIKFELIKSRNAKAGKIFSMVYEQERGYINELSNLEAFYDNGLLEGKSSFNFPGSDIKFTRKNFLTKLESDDRLKESYNNTIEKLKVLLITRNAEEDEQESTNIEPEIKTSRRKKSVVEETTQEEASE